MALLWLDDFESYDNSNAAQEAYTVSDAPATTFSTTYFYAGTRSLKIDSSYDTITKNLGASHNPIIVGFAFITIIQTGGGGYNYGSFYVLNSSGSGQVGIITSARGTAWQPYVTSSTRFGWMPLHMRGVWSYIEMKITVTNSTGASDVLVYQDGELIYTMPSGLDTQAQSGSTLQYIQWANEYLGTMYLDNIYICDTTGSDNNDILGMPLIKTLYPNGNGNQNDWLGSDDDSTDNYLHVDEAPTDGDTSYVQSGTTDDIDLYALGTIDNSDTVHGIQVASIVKMPLGGSKNIQHLVRTNSTNYPGSSINMDSTSYERITTIWENNPDDSNPWEKADIDSLESGVKVVT